MQQWRSMLTLARCAPFPSPLPTGSGIYRPRREARPRASCMFHGTPRREAAALERQLRWLKRRFNIVPLRSIVTAAARPARSAEGRADLRRRPAQQRRGRLPDPAPARAAGDVLRLPGPGRPRALAVDPRGAPPPLAPRAPRRAASSRSEWHAPAGDRGIRRLDEGIRQRRAPAGRGAPARRHAGLRADRGGARGVRPRELARAAPARPGDRDHRLAHPDAPDPAGHAPSELETEVRDSRRQLERGLRAPGRPFAYPNGDLNPEVEACVRKHYRAAVTSSHRLGARAAPHPTACLGCAAPTERPKARPRIYA